MEKAEKDFANEALMGKWLIMKKGARKPTNHRIPMSGMDGTHKAFMRKRDNGIPIFMESVAIHNKRDNGEALVSK
jgi:hypothetical protein